MTTETPRNIRLEDPISPASSVSYKFDSDDTSSYKYLSPSEDDDDSYLSGGRWAGVAQPRGKFPNEAVKFLRPMERARKSAAAPPLFPEIAAQDSPYSVAHSTPQQAASVANGRRNSWNVRESAENVRNSPQLSNISGTNAGQNVTQTTKQAASQHFTNVEPSFTQNTNGNGSKPVKNSKKREETSANVATNGSDEPQTDPGSSGNDEIKLCLELILGELQKMAETRGTGSPLTDENLRQHTAASEVQISVPEVAEHKEKEKKEKKEKKGRRDRKTKAEKKRRESVRFEETDESETEEIRKSSGEPQKLEIRKGQKDRKKAGTPKLDTKLNLPENADSESPLEAFLRKSDQGAELLRMFEARQTAFSQPGGSPARDEPPSVTQTEELCRLRQLLAEKQRETEQLSADISRLTQELQTAHIGSVEERITKSQIDSKKPRLATSLYDKFGLQKVEEMSKVELENVIKNVLLMLATSLTDLPQRLKEICALLQEDDVHLQFSQAVHRILYDGAEMVPRPVSQGVNGYKKCLSDMARRIDRLVKLADGIAERRS